jgi:hypothetical protein
MALAVTRECLVAIPGSNLAQAQAWGPAPEGETENALKDSECCWRKKLKQKSRREDRQPLLVKTECAFHRFSAT